MSADFYKVGEKKALKYISKEKSMSIIYQSEEKNHKGWCVNKGNRMVLETEKDQRPA